jgi:hypothetical protein
VGIGTASPSQKLEISASNQAQTENTTLRFTDTDTTSQTDQLFGKIDFNSLDSDASSPNRAYILSAAENSLTPSYIAFGTAPHTSAATERMRIDSSGRVLINTTSILDASNAKLQVLQDVSAHWSARINNSTGNPFGIIMDYTSIAPNSASNPFFVGTDSVGDKFSLRSNGGLANFSANNANLSDRRSKKDITPHTDNEWDCVKAWEIVDYRYKADADDLPTKIGVIAQQIQEHCPDLVNVFQEQADAVEEVLDEDGEVVTEAKPAVEERIGVNEPQMMWKVTKALQEAMTRIETLEARITTLEG